VQEQQEVGTRSEDPAGVPKPSLARDIALYTLARLSMVVVVAAALMLVRVPGLVALAVSVVVVMPLSLLVFGQLRRRVAAGMAERAADRRARREELRAQLRGERVADAQ
jgi:ABC-type bacteriocin/lantibiotic exporter with double-glycine peptidase domain